MIKLVFVFGLVLTQLIIYKIDELLNGLKFK